MDLTNISPTTSHHRHTDSGRLGEPGYGRDIGWEGAGPFSLCHKGGCGGLSQRKYWTA